MLITKSQLLRTDHFYRKFNQTTYMLLQLFNQLVWWYLQYGGKTIIPNSLLEILHDCF